MHKNQYVILNVWTLRYKFYFDVTSTSFFLFEIIRFVCDVCRNHMDVAFNYLKKSLYNYIKFIHCNSNYLKHKGSFTYFI